MSKCKKKLPTKMSSKDAMDLAESMDLPDGAYWAMVEELSGCDPVDCIEDEDEEAA